MRTHLGTPAAFCVVAFAVFWKFYIAGIRTDVQERTTQLRELESEAAQAANDERRVARALQQIDELQSRFATAAAALPQQQDPASLIDRLAQLAVDSNVAVRRLTPQPPKAQALHTEFSYKAVAEGTYQSLIDFLEALRTFQPIVHVAEITIRAAREHAEGTPLTAEFVLSTFVMHPMTRAGPPAVKAARQSPASAGPLTVVHVPDPFVPHKGGGHVEGSRAPGLPGVKVGELTLRGIMRAGDDFHAVLEGPGKRTYVATAGQKLLDGTVTMVTAGAVTFSQVHDAAHRGRSGETVKRLRPARVGNE